MQNPTIKLLIADIRKTGGTERAVVNLANDLAERKNDVQLISIFSTTGNSFYEVNSRVQMLHLNVIFQQTLSKRVLVGFKELYQSLKLVYTQSKNAIFIATDPFVSFVMARIHTSNSYNKLIVCEHMALSISKKYSVWFRKLFLKKVNAFVLLTDRDQAFLQRIIPTIKSVVIPNRISFSPNRLSSCEEKVILSVGRFEAQKNYLALIDIMSPILQKHKDWKLRIVGQGSQYQAMQNKIAHLQLQQQIILEKPTTEIDKTFYASSIYVMSSIFEGFPMVLLEARAYGLPVVSFDCPNGPVEMIQDYQDGFLIHPEDVLGFRDRVEKLISDSALRKRMGIVGSQDVNNRFSKENIINKWLTLFNDI